jgi:hypothetical protein
MKQTPKPNKKLAWLLTNLAIKNFFPSINNGSFNEQTIYNPIKFSNKDLCDSPLGHYNLKPLKKFNPILETIIEENKEDIKCDLIINDSLAISSTILQDKNLSEEIISKVELVNKSLFECFMPQTSQNKNPDSKDPNFEKSQPSSVFENIGINISHALRKTQDDSKILGSDLTKLFMLDRLFKGNNDSQNR